MTPYRSRTTTHSRKVSGARRLSCATGMNDENLGRLIIVIANPCTQFVAEHVHSPAVGRFIAQEGIEAGGVAWECSTIAVGDGTAMRQYSALQPSVVRPHRRLGGIRGQCPLRGCAGARFQLRSDGCAEMKSWWRTARWLANRHNHG